MKRLSLLLIIGALISQSVLWASTNISQDPNEEVAVEEVDSVTIDSLAIADEVAMEPMSEAELEEAEPAGLHKNSRSDSLRVDRDLWVSYCSV